MIRSSSILHIALAHSIVAIAAVNCSSPVPRGDEFAGSSGGNPAGGSSARGGSSTAPASGGSESGGSEAISNGGATAGGGYIGGGPSASGGRDSLGGSPDAGGAPGAGAASAGAASAGASGMSSRPIASSAEDDGADCAIASLPDSSTLGAVSKAPDPFKRLDGTRVGAVADWRCRRQEIKQLAEKFAYGTKPAKPESVSGSVSKTGISVSVSDRGKSAKFSVTITLPTGGSAPYPAIIVYGGANFGSPLDSNVISSEGIALISYDQYAVGKETGTRTPKTGAFYDVYGTDSATGFLQAWGWGVSRIIDVIEQSDGKLLKADAIGVTGCSRLGKGAFVAGAFDQRIALTMPVESGTAGVPLWRGVATYGGQSLQSAYDEQPWFGDAFGPFTKSPTKSPLDTHEVVAMIAPRGLFIMENPGKASLAAKAGHAAALLGAEVYKALGAEGNITYWSDVANTTHCSQRPEWVAPLKSNIEKFLKKTGNAPGVFKAASNATANLTDWKDWETPNLK